jgi:hypothetical protein
MPEDTPDVCAIGNTFPNSPPLTALLRQPNILRDISEPSGQGEGEPAPPRIGR